MKKRKSNLEKFYDEGVSKAEKGYINMGNTDLFTKWNGYMKHILSIIKA